MHRGRWRPFGCLFLLFGLFAAGTIVLAIWAGAAIIGLVEAPTIVVAAGLIALVVIAIGAMVAARAVRRISQPLDALIDASGAIEAGDYSARVPVDGTREMRSLSRAFNQMSERLEVSDRRRRAFLADVAHELRTPLTVIGGELEAIADGVYPADETHVAILLGHTRAMTRLVEDLRTISLAEVGALELRPQPTDIGMLASEVAASYRSTAAAREASLTVSGPADARILAAADPSALRRVLGNLVTNALRHITAGGRVEIRFGARVGGGATIEVIDDGSGMSAEMVERAFERFEKGPDSDGSGLGLPIAKDLLEAQGGAISLDSAAGAGTTVRVELPPAPPEAS